jgi:hypothetical protein
LPAKFAPALAARICAGIFPALDLVIACPSFDAIEIPALAAAAGNIPAGDDLTAFITDGLYDFINKTNKIKIH